MATVAKYAFKDQDSWRAACNRLSSEVGSGWDTSAPMFDSDLYIEIKDSCTDMGKAADICRGYGGRPL